MVQRFLVSPASCDQCHDATLGAGLRLSSFLANVCPELAHCFCLDTATICVRFGTYLCRGLSPAVAAKRVIAARYDDAVARSDGLQTLEQVPFLRRVWFVIGVLPQTIKLMACSGVPWTQAWGCFYLASFAVVELMGALAEFAPEEDDFSRSRPSDRWLDVCEKSLGTVAVLLQLAILAWVDLAVIPPDPNLIRRWEFRTLRLCGHLVVLLIHVPLIVLMSESNRLSPDLRRAAAVLSVLLICILLAGMHSIDLRYTQMYFMWSIIISASAWLLFFLPVTRRHVLLCDSRTKGYWNVLAFDFFCRIFWFSLFWYVWYYNPSGTSKPKWVEVLG